MRLRFFVPLLLAACVVPPKAPPSDSPSSDRPVAFCTLRDSDAWADVSIRVQRAYTRVLVVDASETPPTAVRVRPLTLARGAPRGEEMSLPVTSVHRTLQSAADAARGGDLVAVMPGRYAGFFVEDRPHAGDFRYVHFKAMGAPGEVTIDTPARADGDRWMVYVRAAHHVILEGFDIAGTPGVMDRKGPRGGIMLDGDFGRTGKLTHHVVVAGNYAHHHENWGFHSTDTRTVLLQDNVFAASVAEHGAYVSDGSDDYVIRRNVFFGNFASGLQVNLDPEASLEEVMKHPAFAGYPKGESAAWALGVIERADALFGEHGYPDGRGVNFIIEGNVMSGNGKRGGGALNLAGLSASLIQNNLIYGNFAHGIAQWDNANPYDRIFEDPGPRAPSEVTGSASLPRFGCHDNVIRNNTVIMANPRRAALQAVHGSFGSVVNDNVLINDEPVSVEISNTGIYRASFGTNVIHEVLYTRGAGALAPLAKALPRPPFGVTRSRFASEVKRYGEEPWILLEKTWWRLNPARPDFHPRIESEILAGKGDRDSAAPRDLEGSSRSAPDLGAFVAR